jgi:hypothetical protein|tara:strand:- start:7253 stop:7651 length:399 start_codon:yes stop_codon:yes gene_type:complete
MDIKNIKKIVEEETGYDLLNKSRKQELVYARAMYYKLCREYSLNSLQTIARSVNKNHATVLHGIKLFDNWICKHDKRYSKIYKNIDEKIEYKFKRESRYKNKEYYKDKYREKLLELRKISNKYRNLKKLVDV